MFSPDINNLDYINNKYFCLDEKYTTISIHYRGNENILTQPENDYYIKAYNYILDRIDNPYFYIFTNDYNIVQPSMFSQTNYKILDKEIDYIHLWTMSKCKHNIISFSRRKL